MIIAHVLGIYFVKPNVVLSLHAKKKENKNITKKQKQEERELKNNVKKNKIYSLKDKSLSDKTMPVRRFEPTNNDNTHTT